MTIAYIDNFEAADPKLRRAWALEKALDGHNTAPAREVLDRARAFLEYVEVGAPTSPEDRRSSQQVAEAA